MVLIDTMDLIGNVLLLKDFAQTIHVFGGLGHLHQGNAEFIPNIQNLQQQVSIRLALSKNNATAPFTSQVKILTYL